MKIVSNNFYYIQDRTLLIQQLSVGPKEIPVGNEINFFVDNESSGQKLSITTINNIFEYDIISDENELQQVYNLNMERSGLVSSINIYIVSSEISENHDLHFNTSTLFKDYDFWFYTKELKINIPNNEIVDKIESFFSENIVNYNFQITALQNTAELIILIESNPQLNLQINASLQFKIFTTNNTYLTDIITVLPGEEHLSECIVSGTFFQGESVLNEYIIQNQNMTIILTLRYETWIDDIQVIRSELHNIITSQIFLAADASHFQIDRPQPINPTGFNILIRDANITRTSEQILTITLNKNIDIIHPETVSIQNIPLNLIRSSISNIPVIVPHAKILLPSPGMLEVITNNSDILSEKDFWTGTTRITLRAKNDVWQDISSLSSTSYQSFHDHIRTSMTSDSIKWTNFVQSMEFSLSSSGSDLFIDIVQQTSNHFNIDSVIEVTIDVGLLTSNGLPTRLSNNNFMNSSTFLLIKPIQSFLSADKDQILESELWNSSIRVRFTLTDDIFISNSNTILAQIKTQFDLIFPSNQISYDILIENLTEDTFVLVFPKASPSSFNINADTVLSFDFSSNLFRNKTNLVSPPISFVSTQLVATMTGTNSLSSQNVISGFSITVDLANDTWKESTINPMNLLSRSDEANGWNNTVLITFNIQSPSKMIVNIQPTPTYNISTIEVIDVYILKNGTYNSKLHYIGNFTIQGSSLIERNHHEYNKKIQILISELSKIRKKIHNVKLAILSPASPNHQNNTIGNFTLNDTIYQRLIKINNSEIQHPISVCRPPLLNGNETSSVQTSVTNVLNQLTNYTIPKMFPNPICVPILCPDFVPTSGNILYSIILSRVLPISIAIDGTTSYLPPSQVHTLVFLQTDHVLSISGNNIQPVAFHRSHAPS